jgi:AbiV family abortive infection protein
MGLQQRCYGNALGIKSDADLLYSSERFSRAAYLYAVALEELAKLPMLGRCLHLATDDEWKKFWKRFREHKAKLTNRALYLVFAAGAPSHTEAVRSFMATVEYVKLASLYIDYQSGPTPEESIDWPEVAKALRLAVEVELPIHSLVVGPTGIDSQLRAKILSSVAKLPVEPPRPGETTSEYVARRTGEALRLLNGDAARLDGESDSEFGRRMLGEMIRERFEDSPPDLTWLTA